MSHSCTGSGTARWPFSLTLINDRKDIVWHRHGVAINKRNSSRSSIKSKLHVLQWKAMDQSRPSSGSVPVAFLVSRKFTAASHPFCLCFVCLFLSFFLSFFSPFCCTGILFVGEFFTDLRAGSSWPGGAAGTVPECGN